MKPSRADNDLHDESPADMARAGGTMSSVPPPVATTLPAWVRLISRLPWPVHYACASLAAVVTHRVLRYRRAVVRQNIAASFPELNTGAMREIERAFYRNMADVAVEFIKAATMSPEELRSRVTLRNVEVARAELAAGRSVLLIAAHQTNWEWLQLALSLELGYPVDAGYKPLRQTWSERLTRGIRTRFGSRLIPAKELLTNIIADRTRVRAIALLADQEPVSSDYRWWTRFLNRPTAFYMGPEKISRAARFPMIFVAMRRVARGRYEMCFERIAGGKTTFEAGVPTEHYARLVENELRARPGDWVWSHRRWKLQPPAASDATKAARQSSS
jgi:KDO2-lipid IV(A) lauroyltransferase